MTTIYSFTNGDQPANGLVEGPDGALYGMTYGSVYKITTTGKLTTLHVFDPADGPQRGGPLLVGRDGVLYGMTGDEHPSGRARSSASPLTADTGCSIRSQPPSERRAARSG